MMHKFIREMMNIAKKEGFKEFELTSEYDLKSILDTVSHEGLLIDSLGNNEWVIYTYNQLNEWMM